MINELSRRRFLSHAGIGVSAAWVSAHWPEMISASAHAHQAVQSGAAYKFDFFTPAEATEIDALTARIIPTDDTPGAREAGVLYFIDRALVTFANGDQQKYRDGLPELQGLVREKFPAVQKFSALSADQQDEILRTLEANHNEKPQRRRNLHSAETFLETLRVHTISGFLIDPEADLGNRGGVGWKLIGREPEHSFQPPFGYYDKDYPGWQPAQKVADKG
jgi:gluconate 2-dehydrogenase gamma chain